LGFGTNYWLGNPAPGVSCSDFSQFSGLVEIVDHGMGRRLAAHGFAHAVEVAHPGSSDLGLLFLDGEINADRGVSEKRQLEADEDRGGNEADADERRIDARHRAKG
jgi:hypothetical protein